MPEQYTAREQQLIAQARLQLRVNSGAANATIGAVHRHRTRVEAELKRLRTFVNERSEAMLAAFDMVEAER